MDISRYIKLFNYGYFLSKYEPKILKSFISASKEVPEINEPLEAGNNQYKKEQVMNKLKLVSKRTKKEIELDKGLEPEI